MNATPTVSPRGRGIDTRALEFRAMMTDIERSTGIAGELEYRFHPTRGWKFDGAFPAALVAVEVDGGVWPMRKRRKDGTEYITVGRHNTSKGFRADKEKLNEAVILGWRTLSFSWSQVGNGEAAALVIAAIRTRPA